MRGLLRREHRPLSFKLLAHVAAARKGDRISVSAAAGLLCTSFPMPSAAGIAGAFCLAWWLRSDISGVVWVFVQSVTCAVCTAAVVPYAVLWR